MVLKRNDTGRAGKVKNATPIVDCCMGKERQSRLLKNGRAKKRRLYNKMMAGVTGNKHKNNSL